jgi:hypothetical protein
VAAVGPCISAKHFEIGPEVADALVAADLASCVVAPGVHGPKHHADLVAAVALQLARAKRDAWRAYAGLRRRDAMRELFSRPGFDPFAPGGANELLRVAPTTGAATFQALMRARADERAGQASARAGAASDRQAAVAGVEMAVKNTALFRDMFANATPDNYDAIRAAAVRAVPQWDAALPTGYTPDGVQRILLTADRALARHFVNQTGEDGQQRVHEEVWM